ncbi:MAG: recombinase family protein [Thermoplasmata archaeon]|nr:recombinase family protein [Thermoplasmata archaeon]
MRDKALRRCGKKCERCWSSRDLEFHHKVPIAQSGMSNLENCVVLCEQCHSRAPLDSVVFDNLFMRFASPKELVIHYEVHNEDEALETWCKETGVDLATVKGEIEGSGGAGLIKERMREKAREGDLIGGQAPFGYDLESGILIMNTEDAETVAGIFEDYLEGRTMVSTADSLNEKGIKTKRGGQWTIWSIRHILRNPIYAGYVRWDGEHSRGKHKPTVSIPVFNSVQEKIVDNIRNPKYKYDPTILMEDE